MPSKSSGFTVIEVLISVAILTLISVTTVVSLQKNREQDELTTAARVLSASIRNLQGEALAGHNVFSCSAPGGGRQICDPNAAASCVSDCTAGPPAHVGMSLMTQQDTYAMFADINPENWRYDGANELISTHSVNPLGNGRVLISALNTDIGSVASISFSAERQSGKMRIQACGDAGLPACSPTEPQTLHIVLHHVITGAEKIIEVNAHSGRVSVQ